MPKHTASRLANRCAARTCTLCSPAPARSTTTWWNCWSWSMRARSLRPVAWRPSFHASRTPGKTRKTRYACAKHHPARTGSPLFRRTTHDHILLSCVVLVWLFSFMRVCNVARRVFLYAVSLQQQITSVYLLFVHSLRLRMILPTIIVVSWCCIVVRHLIRQRILILTAPRTNQCALQQIYFWNYNILSGGWTSITLL